VTTLALVVAALLAAACVVYVALPFLREPAPTDDRLDRLGELERHRLALAEERDRALAALKELEFDHRTGTVSDEDYRAQVGPLRRDAARALRALEPTVTEREEGGGGRQLSRKEPEMEPIALQAPTSVETPEPVVPEPPLVPEPYPPDELTPPEPPATPEPYPPPDEGSPPVPPSVPEPYPPGESRSR
jgi:hypothetical protein